MSTMDHNMNDDGNENANDMHVNDDDVCDGTDHNGDISHNMFYICMLNMMYMYKTTSPYSIYVNGNVNANDMTMNSNYHTNTLFLSLIK